MAIVIPIVSDFNAKGVKQAQKAFSNLQTSAGKVGASVKKAMLGASVAIGALAAASFSAIKAAAEDQKSQALLARQLKTTTRATAQQIAAVEDQITAMSLASGVADDDLRPALAVLVRGTNSVTKAQKALKVALNISRATGRPLVKVAESLAKAYGGNVKALTRLDPSLKSFITKTTTADQAVARLARNFNGAAQAAASTFQGKMERLSIAVNETKEQIGTALLPIAEKFATFLSEKLVPYAQKLTETFGEQGFKGVVKTLADDLNTAQENTTGWSSSMVNLLGTVAVLGAALKGLVELKNMYTLFVSLKAAVVALGGAFTTLAGVSFVTFLSAIGLAVAAVYVLIDALRDPLFRAQFGEVLVNSLKLVANAFIFAYKVIRAGINPLLGLLQKLPGIGKNFGQLPDVKFQDFTTGAGAPQYTNPRMFEEATSNSVVINVNGGDPQAVVDSITRWYRQNGPNAPWMS